MEWDAPEHEHKERTADWFWVAGIIVVALALVSIIFGNIIFGILIVVCAFSLGLFINRVPDNIHIAVTDAGVVREKTLYPYDSLESFWIDTDHPHKKVIIKSKRPLMPLILAPLADNVDVDELRKILLEKLPEQPHSLPLAEKILEYLGF